jgi:hypothetical protein
MVKGKYLFTSEISVIRRYSVKTIKFEQEKEIFSYSLEYNDDYTFMYLCYNIFLNQELTKWLTGLNVNIMKHERRASFHNCLLLEPNLCNNSVNICYLIAYSTVLEIIFNQNNILEVTRTKPDQNLVNYLSQRVNFIRKNAKRILSQLNDVNYFEDMNLMDVKRLYLTLLVSLDGKAHGKLKSLEKLTHNIEEHFIQNAFYYKDSMKAIFNLLPPDCNISPKKSFKDTKIPLEYFILRLGTKKMEKHQKNVIPKIWDKYSELLIKHRSPIDSNYFKSIMGVFLTSGGGSKSFHVLYKGNKCYKPKNINSMRNLKRREILGYLSFPKCAGNAIKSYMGQNLLNETIAIIKLLVQVRKKDNKN